MKLNFVDKTNEDNFIDQDLFDQGAVFSLEKLAYKKVK